MKKKIVVVLLLLLCCACLFANGGREAKKVEGQYANAGGIIGTAIRGIGTTFGIATRSVILALHPFPNIMTEFYGFVEGEYTSTYDGDFSLDMLLTSPNYYTNSGYTNAGINKDTGQAMVTVSSSDAKLTISETDASQSPLQKTRWTITSYLFIVFFAAEVVFTAVFGYIAPQDENASLLRQIGVSAAMTLMLFILASALPFLVEAVRYGLFQIASLYTPVTFDSMYDMPAQFMWEMSYLMETLSWRDNASPIFNTSEKSLTSSLLGSLLAGIIFIVFEFVMGLQAIKAGVHIVANIIEVYLLLSLVMVLLPISVFTPLKGVTRKCVYSLFSNLIECFVLCFIIILVVPACVAACSNLQVLNTALNEITQNTLELKASESVDFSDKKDVDVDWTFFFQGRGTDYVTVASWVSANDSGKMVMYLNENSEMYRIYKDKNDENNISWSEIDSPDSFDNKKIKYEDREKYFKNRAQYILWYFRGICNSTRTVESPVDSSQAEYILRHASGTLNSNNSDIYPQIEDCIRQGRQYKELILNSKAVESNTTYTENSSIVSGLLIAWVFLYLPCFFVMQSTQITNALSNGTAGHESFANAFSHTGGQIMQSLTTAANLVKSAVATAAGASGAMSSGGMAADAKSIHDAMQKEADKDAGGQA